MHVYIKKLLYPQKIYSKGIEGRELKLVSSLVLFKLSITTILLLIKRSMCTFVFLNRDV